MSKASLLQQRLDSIGLGFPALESSLNDGFCDVATILYSSLFLWRIECSNLPLKRRIATKEIIRVSLAEGQVTPWEIFCISVVFPSLTRESNENASSLSVSLALSLGEQIAAAYSLAHVGQLTSGFACLDRVLGRQDVSCDQKIFIYSAFVTYCNTSYFLQAAELSAADFASFAKWLAVFVRNFRVFVDADSHDSFDDIVDTDKPDLLASLDLDQTIRLVHHVACSGGTIISKCLAAMQSVCLLSEVNPINRYGIKFNPTNPLLLYEINNGNAPLHVVKEAFCDDVAHVYRLASRENLALVLRDHSHSDFFSGPPLLSEKRTTLDYCLKEQYILVSALTVRHPLDSFMSLVSVGWSYQFQPSTLDEYCKRYLSFLDSYQDLPVLKYEDFCANPDLFLRKLCSILSIRYDPTYRHRLDTIELSGDSGRSSIDEISLRQRRPVSSELLQEAIASDAYRLLCDRLGYLAY
jgi:hypothetical protein